MHTRPVSHFKEVMSAQLAEELVWADAPSLIPDDLSPSCLLEL